MMAKDEKGGGACLKCGQYFTQFGHMKMHFYKKHVNEQTVLLKPFYDQDSEKYDDIAAPEEIGESAIAETNVAEMKVSRTETGGGLCEICGQFFINFDSCISHYVKLHNDLTAVNLFNPEYSKQVLDSMSPNSPAKKEDKKNTTNMLTPIDINLLKNQSIPQELHLNTLEEELDSKTRIKVEKNQQYVKESNDFVANL